MRRSGWIILVVMLGAVTWPGVATANGYKQGWNNSYVVVNGGAAWTASASVSLQIHGEFDPWMDGGKFYWIYPIEVGTISYAVLPDLSQVPTWITYTFPYPTYVDGPVSRTWSASSTVSGGDGMKSVYAMFTIELGGFAPLERVSPVFAGTIGLDTTPPQVSQTGADAKWHNALVVVKFSATDAGSGMGTLSGSIDRKTYFSGVTEVAVPAPVGGSNDGEHTVRFTATDQLGNCSLEQTCTVRIDTIAPLTSVTGVPSVPVDQPVTLTFTATDDASGVESTEYRIDNGGWTNGSSCSVPAPVAAQTTAVVGYRSTDAAGNAERERTCSVRFDTIPRDTTRPTTTARPVTVRRGATVQLKYAVVDPPYSCGTASVTIQIRKGRKTVRSIKIAVVPTNKFKIYRFKATLAKGTYSYRVLATDAAGNVAVDIGVAKLTIK